MGLFGHRPANVVTVVEAPVLRSFKRKARLTLFASTGAGVVVGGLLLWPVLHPVLAVLFGAVAGATLGVVAAGVLIAWPVLRVLWHWSAELTVLALAAFAVSGLASVTGWPFWLVGLGLAIVFGSALSSRRIRRPLAAWAWCAVVRHRLRVCFAEVIRTPGRQMAGRVPLILLAKPTPAGGRVWVWLRPGLDVTELESRTGKFAVACWAGEVRVVRASTRYAALLRIDLTRRDPLTRPVQSPLPDLVPDWFTTPAAVPADPATLALDLDDVPEPAVETAPRTRRR